MITLFCIHPKGFNVGNDAIQVGLRHLLYEAFGEVINLISVPAVSHYESSAKAGLTARTIHEINQFGHGVIVGGGNLYENGELAVGLDALPTLEPPLMLYSLSRGQIYNRRRRLVDRTDAMPRRVIEALNDRADYSLARDQATLDYLHGIGCKRAQLGGCPTIFLNQTAGRFESFAENQTFGPLISVRNPQLMNIPLDLQARVHSDVQEIISFLKRQGLSNIRLLCHDCRDITFAASFTGVEYVYTGDVYSYLSLLKTSPLSISYRLHATLPCMTFGTPCINIGYDQRALSLMDTLGLGQWDINSVTSESVVDDVIDRYRRLESLSGLRAQVQPRWKAFFDFNMDTFRRFAHDVREFCGVYRSSNQENQKCPASRMSLLRPAPTTTAA